MSNRISNIQLGNVVDSVPGNWSEADQGKDVSDKKVTVASQKPSYVQQLEKNLGDKSNMAGSGQKVPDLIAGLENLGENDSSGERSLVESKTDNSENIININNINNDNIIKIEKPKG